MKAALFESTLVEALLPTPSSIESQQMTASPSTPRSSSSSIYEAIKYYPKHVPYPMITRPALSTFRHHPTSSKGSSKSHHKKSSSHHDKCHDKSKKQSTASHLTTTRISSRRPDFDTMRPLTTTKVTSSIKSPAVMPNKFPSGEKSTMITSSTDLHSPSSSSSSLFSSLQTSLHSTLSPIPSSLISPVNADGIELRKLDKSSSVLIGTVAGGAILVVLVILVIAGFCIKRYRVRGASTLMPQRQRQRDTNSLENPRQQWMCKQCEYLPLPPSLEGRTSTVYLGGARGARGSSSSRILRERTMLKEVADYHADLSLPLDPKSTMWERLLDKLGFQSLQGPSETHYDITSDSATTMKCVLCKKKFPGDKEKEEAVEAKENIRKSAIESSPSTSVLISSLPFPRYSDLNLSRGSVLYGLIHENTSSCHTVLHNNRGSVYVHPTDDEMCRVESFYSDISSSLFIELPNPIQVQSAATTSQPERINNSNDSDNNNNSKDKNKGKNKNSNTYSDEIQHPAKVESLTIPHHLWYG